MLVTYNWLREFVDITHSPRELADILTMGGLEVESVEMLGAGLDHVVVGGIVKIEKHPNADRLTVCQVDVGKELLTIVCGAKNMAEGDHVPVAQIGAVLPNGTKIEKTVLRGVTSHGMMCSSRELGMGEEHSGLLILSKETKVGDDIRKVLGLDDTVFSIGVTPNRPDCLSVIGVAREIASLTGVPLRKPQGATAGRKAGESAHLIVSVQNKSLCPCYTGQVITGVNIGPSPEWMKRRLQHVGLRSINNVVDITNYVLFECGHPIHAFDAGLIAGKQILIRNARQGEKLSTLDGVLRELDPEMLVIADADRAIALAGVMGGANTEISDATTAVFLESAYFMPETVRRTSKRLGLQTDSSYRFERGVDPYGVHAALHRAAGLIRELCGGAVEDAFVEDRGEMPQPRKIALRYARLNRMLGTEIGRNDLKNILNVLQLPVQESGDVYTVSAPTYRVDLEQEIDLIEEVARVFGYRNIPVALPEAPITAGETDLAKSVRDIVKGVCAAQGLHEIVTYSFVDRGAVSYLDSLRGIDRTLVPVSNPISDEQNVMRTSLVHSMLKAIAHNRNMGAASVKFFETGKSYRFLHGAPAEQEEICVGMTGLETGKEWYNVESELDFFTLKGVFEAVTGALGVTECRWHEHQDRLFQPGSCAALYVGDECAGVIGKVHPDVSARYEIKKAVFAGECRMDVIARHAKLAKGYRELPKYPTVKRDIALVVDEGCKAGAVVELVKGIDAGLIRSVSLFDVFKGGKLPEHKKSMAFRICFRSDERTLTDAEVAELHDRIVGLLKKELQCDIREI
ncbi:MAG TPA: phenylalanine--tRNA ligase subunit beta [bacterium]|nr:phenylalanine--tRNA ligase subunit beta [bacterium]